MKDFNYWKKLHDSGNLEEFNTDRYGLLWLKTKSLIRKKIVADFTRFAGIELAETALSKQFVELFGILSNNCSKSDILLNEFICSESKKQLAGLDVEQLVSELYKLKNFDWGGDYQNSLDKYLVSRYVKKLTSFNALLSKFEEEINAAVQGYVLNSWYNHWTSIVIEHIFKSHPLVIPTVGQIKGVDFFVNNFPFDLKVTYLPSEYVRLKRKEMGLQSEVGFLKNNARMAGIKFDARGKEGDIVYEIVEKMKDRDDDLCREVLRTLENEKQEILKDSRSNPKILAKWLYENQGEMRFGSENRLFLVLVDTDDFNASWKLKRNFDILKPSSNNYLDNFRTKNIEDLKLNFTFKGKPNSFNVLTDVIFVTK